MDKYDFSHIPDLSDEEKKDPYSKFYYVPVNPPAQYLLDAIVPGKYMDGQDVMLPSDLGKLFSPGYLSGENGYVVTEEGLGCIAINTKLPGVTPEMEAFWNGWFRSDDLYYKIWLPGLHYGHRQIITEDLGWGAVELFPYSFVDITQFANGNPKALDPNFVSVMGGSVYFDEGEKRSYLSLVHYMRATGEGMEIRTRSWFGLTLETDGSYTVRLEKGERADPEKIRLLAAHHAWEFTRKADLLPGVFAFSKTL